MEFETLQQAWQAQPPGFKLTIDSTLLLREVKRNYQSFAAETRQRDLAEAKAGVTCALFLIVVCIVLKTPIFLCMVPFCIYAATFFFIDRKFLRRKQAPPSESLDSVIRACLAQVEHQIWLVGQVVIGGLLPLGLSFACVVALMLREIIQGGCRVLWVWIFVAGIQPLVYTLVL